MNINIHYVYGLEAVQVRLMVVNG